MGKKKEIGIRIRTMRKSRGMTQEDLAKAICQSASSITMYETGRRAPDYETLEALADTFNVPMSSLVSEEISAPEMHDDEIRLLIPGVSKLPSEQVERTKKAFLAMFKATYPELFEGDDDK